MNRLIAAFGSARVLVDALDGGAAPASGAPDRAGAAPGALFSRVRERWTQALAPRHTAWVRETWGEGHVVVICDDAEYPANLRGVATAPPVLFVRGAPAAVAPRALALVGTVSPSARGCARARRLARLCAGHGIQVVSGLARGIDGAAHRAALDAGVATVAVVGHGHRYLYPPEHASLAAAIAGSGAVVSQFPPTTPPSRWTFAARNELMVALARGTVIVEIELADRSGSLIQARFTLRHGRPLFVLQSNLSELRSPEATALVEAGEAVAVCDFAEVLARLEVATDVFRRRAVAPADAAADAPADAPAFGAAGGRRTAGERLAAAVPRRSPTHHGTSEAADGRPAIPAGPAGAATGRDAIQTRPEGGPEDRPEGAVLFDLDGVLYEPRDVLTRAYRDAIGACDREVEAEELAPLLHLAPPQVFRRFGVAARTAAPVFQRAYGRAIGEVACINAPVVAFLRRARAAGLAVGVVTAQTRTRFQQVAARAGVGAELDVAITWNDVPRAQQKPHPAPLLRALEYLRVTPDWAAYVGGTPSDVLAARRAGVLAVAVTWGLASEAALRQCAPDLVLSSPADLDTLLKRLRSGGQPAAGDAGEHTRRG